MVWRTVPALLFSLFAGVWVDRLRRRPLMIGADLANIVLLASIPAAAALGMLRIEQVYLVMFLTSFADILFSVGYRAYLPTLVGRDAITKANSILSATEAVAEMGAFGLAGWLVQWLTAPIAIAIGCGVIRVLGDFPAPHQQAGGGARRGARIRAPREKSRRRALRSSMTRGCSRSRRARPSARSRRGSSAPCTRSISSTYSASRRVRSG